jgi:hypothetical protein
MLTVGAGYARAAVSGVILTAQAHVTPGFPPFQRYFPLAAPSVPNVSNFNAPVTAVMRFIDAFGAGALARPIIIFAIIVRRDHTAG